MAYVPKTWKTGDMITADSLNNLEQGVQAADTAKSKCVLVNLPASGWTDSEPCTQNVTVTGVTDSNVIIVSPDPTSWEAAGKEMIYCSSQALNSLTFTSKHKPTSDLSYNVLIQEV